jgi:hypothetical protein
MAGHRICLQLVFATNADFFAVGPLPDTVVDRIAEFCGPFLAAGVSAEDGWLRLYWKVTFLAFRRLAKHQRRVLEF